MKALGVDDQPPFRAALRQTRPRNRTRASRVFLGLGGSDTARLLLE